MMQLGAEWGAERKVCVMCVHTGLFGLWVQSYIYTISLDDCVGKQKLLKSKKVVLLFSFQPTNQTVNRL